MFKHVSMRIKLSAAFLLIAVIVGGVGLYQLRVLQDANSLFKDIIENDFARQETLDKVKLSLSEIEKNVLEAGGPSRTNTATRTQKLDDLQKQLATHIQTYEHYTTKDIEPVADESQIDLLSENTQAVSVAAKNHIAALAKNSGTTATGAAYGAAIVAAHAQTDYITELETKAFQEENAEIASAVARVERTILWLVGGTSVVAMLLGLVLAAALGRPLKKLAAEAKYIANGDFTRRVNITTHDELGQLGTTFNEMATRLRDSYQRLAVESERDKTLLESLSEGVIALDDTLAVTHINAHALQLIEQQNAESVVGKAAQNVLPLLTDKLRAVDAKDMPFAQAHASKEVVREVYSLKHANGTVIKVDIGASPVIVNDKLTGVIMNLRDVTKEKEIDRMKTEFISLASHQLRTPLSAIKWFSEMLQSGDAGKLNPDQEEFARNIADSTERMIALVNALLNISRIESGRIVVDPKPTDLRELVGGIVNDLKAKTEDKKQTLIISVHEDLPKINVDPRLIGQVYMNLLTNAIKYTPKGGEVSVFISRKDEMVISQVTDNGYGIPKEQQGRIFEKFFRAANAVKVETDGTGLGLYLIKAIVESSGGKIWFESEEGKGTTFWFSIPLSGMQAKEGEVTLDA